jgi:UrcA family protein
MPYSSRHRAASGFCSAFTAIALAMSGAPAGAQTVEEVVVMGKPDKLPETMSYRVSYRDIDIRTKAGQDELARRVNVTATHICRKLGDGDVSACRDKAVSQAMPKVRAAEVRAIAQHANWRPGPKWVAPSDD